MRVFPNNETREDMEIFPFWGGLYNPRYDRFLNLNNDKCYIH